MRLPTCVTHTRRVGCFICSGIQAHGDTLGLSVSGEMAELDLSLSFEHARSVSLALSFSGVRPRVRTLSPFLPPRLPLFSFS